MKTTAILSIILFILLSVALLSSCSREETETATETVPDPVITETVTDQDIVENMEEAVDQDIVENMEEEIVADFTVTLGTHEDGEALFDSLT